MRTLKLALAAVAVFAFNNANAQSANPANIGMGMGTRTPPAGFYQPPVEYTAATDTPDGQAFHAGGVAACDGCHVMHNASSGFAKSTAPGSAVAPWTNVTNMYLLQGTDQSSTCLICHNGTGPGTSATPTGTQFTIRSTEAVPTNRTPGGDFGWLVPTWGPSAGERHGHNVVAADFGMTSDTRMSTAPGGTWTGGAGRRAFACSSCHDPHGRTRVQTEAGALTFVGPGSNGLLPANALPIGASGSYGNAPGTAASGAAFAVGSYRLLGGQYYAPASNPSSPFPNDPPLAVAPIAYNRSESATDVRVAYGSGMSEWCQNCHANIHMDSYSSGVAGLRHPAGSLAFLHSGQIDVYNSYISTGKMQVSANGRYSSLVPFEQTDLNLAQLKTRANGTDPIVAGPRSAVMCLSCHRAHATAFDSMVRWDQNATFLTDGNGFTAGIATGRPTAATTAGYYDRAFSAAPDGTSNAMGPYQRSLCNKCHGKD